MGWCARCKPPRRPPVLRRRRMCVDLGHHLGQLRGLGDVDAKRDGGRADDGIAPTTLGGSPSAALIASTRASIAALRR